jgi:hypothetical protein
MKKLFIYPVVILMAALVFCGGSGVNVASFCCDDCQSGGIEGIVEGFCSEVHHHDHDGTTHPKPDTDSVGDVHEMCCTLSRVMFDWTTSNAPVFSPEPVVYDLTVMDLPEDLVVSGQILNCETQENSTGPPFPCPRSYLSLLTTLLI